MKKVTLVLYAFALAVVVAWKVIDIEASYHSLGKPVSILLTRGAYTILEFPSKEPDTRAIILFGSGDGGWSGFEEEICYALQAHGYEAIGINSNEYAETDYDLATLQADFKKIARTVEIPYGTHPRPLVVGGWSMGAAQAIAVAGGPNRPPGLAGLLVVDPCSRGRYGLRLSDRSDFLPTGTGTFGVDEFVKTMGNLHVVQWHAEEDSIDSRAWLNFLTTPHREFDFANTGHYYTNGREAFLRQLVDSVPWILTKNGECVTTTRSVP